MNESGKLRLFETTMLPHLSAAHNLARWLTKNPQDAEDLVQESYVKAFRYFDGFRGGNSAAWLLAIVRNTCLTWLGATRPAEAFDERIHAVENRSMSAEESADIGSLRRCIEALPVEYREAVVMRELEGWSYREIADAAAAPIGTVMSRLSRARKKLMDCMNGGRL